MNRAFLIVAAFPLLALSADWQTLFDGKSLDGWKEAAFRNPGKVRVDSGAIVLDPGHPLTGINYTREIPRIDYEIRYEAQKHAGGDFFASLTFPVAESYCTFVTGGWGGDIVGLSSIDEWDASENETRTYFQFEPKRWYKFRIEVTADRLRTWIDEEKINDVKIAGRRISLRPGPIELSVPFGFAAYNTGSAIRNIAVRPLR